MTGMESNAYLVIESGASAGRRVPIDRVEFPVGRSDTNALILADPTVSRQHVILRLMGDQVELVDLGSTGGTFVNDRRVERATLQTGDRIVLGDVRLRFEFEPRAAATVMPGGMQPAKSDARLPAAFVQAQGQFWILRARYEQGELDEGAYRQALKDIVFHDDAGAYWMLGAESGAWYRHEQGVWVGRQPPQADYPAVPPPPIPPASQPDRQGAGSRGRILVVVLGVLLLITTCVTGVVAVSRFIKSFEEGDVQAALSVDEEMESEEVGDSAELAEEEAVEALPAVDSTAYAPQETATITTTPTETTTPGPITPLAPVVTLHVGDARTFSQPPETIAYANLEQRPAPPEIVIKENCTDNCWRYHEWLAMGQLGLWIEATSTIPVNAMGVEFWGDQNDGWARVLLDGEEIWQGDTRGQDANWPGGAFVRYLEIAGLPWGIHTLRVEPLGEGGPATMYYFGIGQVMP
jgi:hypothetical protein